MDSLRSIDMGKVGATYRAGASPSAICANLFESVDESIGLCRLSDRLKDPQMAQIDTDA